MALSAGQIPVPPNSGAQIISVRGVDVESLTARQQADRDAQYPVKSRMTWEDHGRLAPKGPRGVGRVNKNLPYSLVEGLWYIQNCRVFLGNGLTEVDPYTYDFCPGDPVERERRRARVLDAYLSYNQTALDEDPLLCPYCLKYHAANPLDFADHMVRSHADKYGQHLGYGDEQAKAAEPEPVKVENLPAVPSGYTATPSVDTVKNESGHPVAMKRNVAPLDLTPLACIKPCGCGKTFMGKPALKRHLTAYRKRAAKA